MFIVGARSGYIRSMSTPQDLAEAGDLGRFGSADRLAEDAGVAPVLRASGGSVHQRRPKRGNRILKRVFYQSAFCSFIGSGASRAFYERKRKEGKAHKQAVMALARRRVNVLWAMLRDGRAYEEQAPEAAWLKHQDARRPLLDIPLNRGNSPP